jgi:hypothetical protein
MSDQNEQNKQDETVFGADYPVLIPTGKGKAPKIKDRPEPKKKKQTMTPTPKKGGKAPLPKGVFGYQPVVQQRPSTIDHPFNW